MYSCQSYLKIGRPGQCFEHCANQCKKYRGIDPAASVAWYKRDQQRLWHDTEIPEIEEDLPDGQAADDDDDYVDDFEEEREEIEEVGRSTVRLTSPKWPLFF